MIQLEHILWAREGGCS